jgi:hypothetical protein
VGDKNVAPPRTVERGGLIEYHVRINKAFANPFDPCVCDLMGVVTMPSVTIESVDLTPTLY